MLETINTQHELKNVDYKKDIAALRLNLLQHQIAISKRDKPVILVIAGDDRSGRHETINALLEWLDPRFVRVNAYGGFKKREKKRPFFWRYWRDLPAAGKIGIYLREWTSTSVVDFLNKDMSKKKLNTRIINIQHFEQALSDDGALIIKFWLHMPKAAHKKRLKQVRNTAFYDKKDKLALKNYDEAISTIDNVLTQTNTDFTPWFVVNSENEKQRNWVVGNVIEKRMQAWLNQAPASSEPVQKSFPKTEPLLDKIDLSKQLDNKEYDNALAECRFELRTLMMKLYKQKRSLICAFEGVDAAGKGGAIRRLVGGLDAGQYQIIPVAKPTDEEAARHYLWRFWRHVPENGMMTIFDRTWYGRVLVERVEGFASQEQWQRAYQEINDFEQQLNSHGTLVLKFWLHIDQQEQLKRFQARENIPYKQHKITEEDYRNREKWPHYSNAIEDMLTLTNTEHSPWHVIPAQDKRYARIAVFETVINALKKQLHS